MKNILCFGDSNTWGYVAGSFEETTGLCKRYEFEKRWPGILEKNLGQNYRVIEAGLNGRTTDIDDPDWAERNGLKSFASIFESASPIDLVIIMLGTNDLKSKFKRTPASIANGIENLINLIREKAPKQHILVISPPIIRREDGFGEEFKGASMKSSQFDILFKKIASEKSVHYFNASQVPLSSLDGIHLDQEGHKLLGEGLIELIKTFYPSVEQKTYLKQNCLT